MAKVTFIFDKEADLRNIHRVCTRKYRFTDPSKGMNKKVLGIAKGKSFGECRKELEEYYKVLHESPLIPIVVKVANDAWGKVESEYFKRLEKLTKKPIYTDKFTAELTTISCCPYDTDKNSFMVPFFSSIPGMLATAGHEIMHLQFHHYFWKDIEKEIGWNKTDDLKEALTVLLNTEFKYLWFVPDKGYTSHKKLRKFIAKEWEKEKDFDVLLEKCVEWIKKRE